MAYAVLLRQKGTDGSLAEHWWPDFQTGDSPERRDTLQKRPPDPKQWELVQVDRQAYWDAELLVYGPHPRAAETEALESFQAWLDGTVASIADQVDTVLANRTLRKMDSAERGDFEARLKKLVTREGAP